MPTPVITNVYRVVFQWAAPVTGFVPAAVNVMHVRSAEGNPTTVLGVVSGAVTGQMWGPVSDGAAVDRMTCQKLDGTSAPVELATTDDADFVGQTPGNPIPQSAAIIKLTTALGGRSHRGRLYLPYVSEGAQNNGSIPDDITGPTTDAWTDFQTAIGAASPACEVVVASYLLETAARVTGFVCESPTGTQRRRQTRNR